MDAFIQWIEQFACNPAAMFGLLWACAFVNVFFPPVPIETGTALAGYLSGLGKGSLWVTISATSLGMFMGSMVLFALCRRYGLNAIEKTPLRRFIDMKTYPRAHAWVERYGVWTLFLGKLAPGMSLVTVASCGVFKLDYRHATIAILLSNVLFFAGLTLAGRMLGKHWADVAGWVSRGGFALLITAVVVGAVSLCIYLRRRKRA